MQRAFYNISTFSIAWTTVSCLTIRTNAIRDDVGVDLGRGRGASGGVGGHVGAGTSTDDDGEALEGEDGHDLSLAPLDKTVSTVLAEMWRPIVSVQAQRDKLSIPEQKLRKLVSLRAAVPLPLRDPQPRLSYSPDTEGEPKCSTL